MNTAIGFQWDEANRHKNWKKHRVNYIEAEQIFFNTPLVVENDIVHSSDEEKRCLALGKTNDNRLLTVIYIFRNNLICIISARPMSKKERNAYEKIS